MPQRYEALMLAVPELTKDETVLIEKQIDDLVRKGSGSTLSFERSENLNLNTPFIKMIMEYTCSRDLKFLKDQMS